MRYLPSARLADTRGPLGEGLLVGDTVRCPWHHACFSLRTGEAIRAPALYELPCFAVETGDGKLFVRQAGKSAARTTTSPAAMSSVVILGGGVAAQGALETLRREGYGGPITVLSADADPPYDRPNLSKDHLAGTASEDWIPLRDAVFCQQHGIDLRLGTRVVATDAQQRLVRTQDGSAVPYGALLIATGAEPVRLDVPGATLPHVHHLRSLADSRSLIEAAGRAKCVAVIGATPARASAMRPTPPLGVPQVISSHSEAASGDDFCGPGRSPRSRYASPCSVGPVRRGRAHMRFVVPTLKVSPSLVPVMLQRRGRACPGHPSPHRGRPHDANRSTRKPAGTSEDVAAVELALAAR